MFTRKNGKETPSPDTELFNNRLKELKSADVTEASSHPELNKVPEAPLPIPQKLRKRSNEPASEAEVSQRDSHENLAVNDELQTGEANSKETVISRDLVIHGDVKSKGVIRLEGTVYGDMHCSALVVEELGAVSGNVKAIEVNVHGRVEGTLNGQSVMLHSTAFVEGDIYHQGIGIEMGTHYDGRLQWVDARGNALSSSDAEDTRENADAFYAEAAE